MLHLDLSMDNRRPMSVERFAQQFPKIIFNCVVACGHELEMQDRDITVLSPLILIRPLARITNKPDCSLTGTRKENRV